MMEDGAQKEMNVEVKPDQIITWGGPIATFRWDGATMSISRILV